MNLHPHEYGYAELQPTPLPTPLPAFNPDYVDGLHKRITELEQTVESLRNRLEAARQELGDRIHKHNADIETISEALLDLSADDDWADECDEFIERLNDRLAVKLLTRNKDYDVTRTYTVTYNVIVTAKNEKEAKAKAADIEEPRFHDNGHRGGWDYIEYELDDERVEESL